MEQTGTPITRQRSPRPATLVARFAALDERATDRWITRLALVLVVGTIAVGAVYAFDRFRLPEPSLIERSVAAAEQAVVNEPNRLSARLDLARAYVAAERPLDAIAQYDQILAIQGDVIPALLGRGRVSAATGSLDVATSDFQAVVRLIQPTEMAPVSPELQSAYYNLGMIALRRGEPDGAIAWLTEALRITGTDADSLHAIGQAYVATGAFEEARASLAKAVALVPWGWCDPYAPLGDAFRGLKDEAGASYASGMLAACEGRYGEAESLLQAEVSGVHGIDALIGLGLMAEARKDGAAAGRYYAEVYAQDRTNVAAIQGLNRIGANEDGTLRAPAEDE